MLRFIPLILAFWIPLCLDAQVPSPSDFLPYAQGEQFTLHHQVVDYAKAVEARSPRVSLQPYGTSYEGRPLLLAAISTPENLQRLEDIRKNNLRRVGLLEGETDPSLDLVIVWLSFGVHGNEAGATESALAVLYELAREDNAAVEEWLQHTIVLLDPCLNPDGYARYTQWYRSVATTANTPERLTREHREPWPAGRTNHYLFDLNRDWAWQTQQETRQRLAVYHDWMPHIHVDYHEQFPDSPYYFAPATEPYHAYITDWQTEFQYRIGKAHARYFDQNGWLYFTREVFDLLYPSYGDTYPIFNGAIGMTHEQAGHGIAGRSVLMENGDTLLLRDRIAHHTATALSTVEAAAQHRAELLEEFEAYFASARRQPMGRYKTFVISQENPSGRISALLDLLDRNHIRYSQVRAKQRLRAYDYQQQAETTITIEEGDLLVSAHQPLSVLVQVLFEPEPELEDSLTYDITAWALPYAFGLEAAALEQRLEGGNEFHLVRSYSNIDRLEAPYAYLLPWNSREDARFLGALLQAGIKLRTAGGAFAIEGSEYESGTLVITAADNRKMGADFHKVVKRLAKDYGQGLRAVSTGFSQEGSDLGSGGMSYLPKPRVAVMGGEHVKPGSYGEVWHFFERVLEYPAYFFRAEDLAKLDLYSYTTLILPEGQYDFSERSRERLQQWMKAGGRLIAIGTALRSLEGIEPLSLKRRQPAQATKEEAQSRIRTYGGISRWRISRSLPGAIFQLGLDATHPFAAGMGARYFSLKTSASTYELLDEGWNIAYLPESPKPIGFVGQEALQQMPGSLVVGQEKVGQGSAVYLVDNPLFRAFWYQGQLLFANVIFMPD